MQKGIKEYDHDNRTQKRTLFFFFFKQYEIHYFSTYLIMSLPDCIINYIQSVAMHNL